MQLCEHQVEAALLFHGGAAADAGEVDEGAEDRVVDGELCIWLADECDRL